MIDGIYHHVSLEHLQAYVNDFSRRWNTRHIETSERFNVILGNITGQLPYAVLITHD
jgi:hypothetical protein